MPLTLTDEQVRRLLHAYETILLGANNRSKLNRVAVNDILSILQVPQAGFHTILHSGIWELDNTWEEASFWEALK